MSETNFKIGKSLQLPEYESIFFGDKQFFYGFQTEELLFDGNALATTYYVDTAISNLIDSAPSTLDTLNEIAAALNDSANIANVLFAYIDNAVSNIDVPEGFITSASNSFGVNSGELSLASGVAGPGIGYNEGRLEVNVANGLTISNDTVVLNTSTVAGPGLYPMDGGTLTVNAGNGLTITDDALVLAVSNAFFTSGGDGLLRLVPDVAGSGLSFNENIISVNVANGISISNDTLVVDTNTIATVTSVNNKIGKTESGTGGYIEESRYAGQPSANTWTLISPVSSYISPAAANFTSGEYTVAMKAGSAKRISKIAWSHDGTTVSYNEYGIVESGTIAGADLRVVLNGGNVRLEAKADDASGVTAWGVSFAPEEDNQ